MMRTRDDADDDDDEDGDETRAGYVILVTLIKPMTGGVDAGLSQLGARWLPHSLYVLV